MSVNMEEMLLERNAPEDFPGKEAIWQRIEAGERAKRRRPARMGLRVAALAAVIMALATTTVFAEEIAEGIRQLVNGGLSATAHEELIAHDGEEIIGQITYSDREQLVSPNITEENVMDVAAVYFTTLEEAQAVAPYTLKAPAWLPDGYAFERAGVLRAPDGIYMEEAFLSYTAPGPSADESTLHIGVSQTWVGPRATVDMDIVGDYDTFQAVTVNGCEGIYTPTLGLKWIEDSVFYEVGGVLTLEEAMQIAESLQ